LAAILPDAVVLKPMGLRFCGLWRPVAPRYSLCAGRLCRAERRHPTFATQGGAPFLAPYGDLTNSKIGGLQSLLWPQSP
jgi:hypothetical protein